MDASGEVMNINVLSFILTRITDPVDATLSVYDSSGNLVAYYNSQAFNDDGYETGDFFFAGVLLYLYTEDSLSLILLEDDSVKFRFDIASLDAEILRKDYDDGQLQLSDARAFAYAYNAITSRVKRLRKSGEGSWASQKWIAGKSA